MNPAELANIARVAREFWWYRGMEKILFRVLDPVAHASGGCRLLDAGCGTGDFARVLEQRYDCRIFPCDVEAQAVGIAQRSGLRCLTRCDIGDLPYACATFDMLISLDVLVHLQRGRECNAIQEFSRVLAPGGLLVLRVAALDILRSSHSLFIDEKQRFTRRRLVELVSGYGFRVLRCTYANAFLFPVALARFRIWEPLTRAKPASGVQPIPAWLNKLLYVPLALEAELLGRGWNLPVGQSLILIGEKAA